MTREEILAMEPGRELDKLVFKFVIGGRIPEPPLRARIMNFSTEISAAFEVINKMREKKIYLDIRVWPNEYQVLPHQDENNKLIERWIVKSLSLPEAICKAALLAILPGEE